MKHDIGDRVVITDLGMNMPKGLSIFNDSYMYFMEGQILLGTPLGERCKKRIWTVVMGFSGPCASDLGINQITETYLIRNENLNMELVVNGKGLLGNSLLASLPLHSKWYDDTPVNEFLTEKDMEI